MKRKLLCFTAVVLTIAVLQACTATVAIDPLTAPAPTDTDATVATKEKSSSDIMELSEPAVKPPVPEETVPPQELPALF